MNVYNSSWIVLPLSWRQNTFLETQENWPIPLFTCAKSVSFKEILWNVFIFKKPFYQVSEKVSYYYSHYEGSTTRWQSTVLQNCNLYRLPVFQSFIKITFLRTTTICNSALLLPKQVRQTGQKIKFIRWIPQRIQKLFHLHFTTQWH